MAKVDQNLLAGETVLFRTQHHWTINKNGFVLATICCAIGVTLVGAWLYTPVDQRTFSVAPGEIFLVAGILVGGWAQWSVSMAEFAVTNQRVLFRMPLRSFDLFMYQVQQVSFHKSPLADYGTIMVTAAGVMEVFSHIQHVERFATTIEQQVALMHQRTGASATPSTN